nr:FAD-dependent oxidoreductase [Notoacmeibacter sp. MSK16QG-6]
MPKKAEYDLVVIGSGAAGMAAATFGAMAGSSVLLLERTKFVGGTSAYSAATTWVPNTRFRDMLGAEDSKENVLAFLDRAVGNRAPRALREAFVENGPSAIHALHDETSVKFRGRPFHPDYLHELEGSTSFGRALEPEPFDGLELGDDLALIRPPIPEFTILNGLQIDRDDIPHLLAMKKKFGSFTYSMRLVAKYYLQRLRHGRSTRLLMGNALIGRFLCELKKRDVALAVEAKTEDLQPVGSGSWRLKVSQRGSSSEIIARQGVILATGGYGRNPQKREAMLPQPTAPYSPAAPGHTGELHDIALRQGAHYGETNAQPAFWAPVSVRRRADGSEAVFPHFVLDRSKPGIIAVGRDGKRFTNETRSYHEFVSAMYAANNDGSHMPVFLIADARAIQKYGLGMVRPGTTNLKPFLADGYLNRGGSLAELAAALDIDGDALEATVDRYNGFVAKGVDKDFHRGETIYERANGDASHGPNPTLGSLDRGPFYAVSLWPGDIGAATGLVVDEHARLLREDGTAIDGLYACGADMNSIMGGVYPGPGITIGPGIVFGYIAANHAAKSAISVARQVA